jgi:hypothetical protein
MIAIETLREAVARLSLKDRAAFAAYVLQTLPPPVKCQEAELRERRMNRTQDLPVRREWLIPNGTNVEPRASTPHDRSNPSLA